MAPTSMKRILISLTGGLVIGLVLGIMLGRKLQPTEAQVVDLISHLSFPQLAEFNKKLSAQAGLQVYQTQILAPSPAVQPVPTPPR
jgi:xanthosine utilization system XapX-like protein